MGFVIKSEVKKMKTVKIIFSSLAGIVSTAISICLVWGLLYLCITPVREWTDNNIFYPKHEEVVEDTQETETSEEVNIENIAKINFVTKTIKVDI